MLNVAVTGLNAGDTPAPGVPVVRCLRESAGWKGRIVGLGYDALDSGILDRTIVDSAYLIPYPNAGNQALLQRLRRVHEREHLDAIIPNLDSEIQNFISIEPELNDLGIRVFLPTEEQFKRRSKANLAELCEKSGIKTPKTTLVKAPGELDLDGMKYPVVVKGSLYEAYVAHHESTARGYVEKLAASWGYPILTQEFIDGEEFNAAAVGDGEGNVVGWSLMKKLVLTDRGKGWACVSIENEGLVELMTAVVRELKWRGPIEIEAIQSRKTGELYLIELNPRFPAWIYLAKASGVNLPSILLDLIAGREVQAAPSHRPGVVFSNYTTNLVMDLASISSLFTCGELHHEKAV